MPLCKHKNWLSFFPLFIMTAVTESVTAFDTNINLPNEAFLNFLASGIEVQVIESALDKTSLEKNESNNQETTGFIDPMEIHELDNIGLLAKLNLQPKKSEPDKMIHTNQLTKENKE